MRELIQKILLAIVLVLVLFRFVSEWRLLEKIPCGDLRYMVQCSRQLMHGYDPYFYITPFFESWEFGQDYSSQKLREAIAKQGIIFPQKESDIKALNDLARNKRLISRLLSNSPALKKYLDQPTVGAGDQVRKDREVLSRLYPSLCPNLQRKNDFGLNKNPVLVNEEFQPASPAFLTFFYPLFSLPYAAAKKAWFMLTWLLAILSIHLLARCASNAAQKRLIWISCLFFLGTSDAFHLHIVRGQKYVIFLFLLSAVFYLFQKNRDFMSGFIMGILISVRFNALLIMAALCWMRRGKMLAGVLSGIAVTLVLTSLLSGPSVWWNFCAQVDKSVELTIRPMAIPTLKYGHSRYEGATDDMLPSFYQKDYVSNYINASFIKGPQWYKWWSGHQILKNIFKLGILGLVLCWLWRLVQNSFQEQTPRTNALLFLAGTGLFLLSNYCLKVNWLYTDVLWIFPMTLIIMACDSWETPTWALGCFLFFSAFGFNLFEIKGTGSMLGEIIILLALPFVLLHRKKNFS